MAVSANFQSIGKELTDIATQSDFRGLVGLGLVGGLGGGVLADQISERVLPLLGVSSNPNTAQGLAISGLVKWAIAFLFALSAARLGRGTLSNLLAVGSLGPVVTGAVDLGDAVNRMGLFRSSMPTTNYQPSRAVGGGNSGNVQVQAQQPQTAGGTQTAHQPVEEQRTAATAGY